MKKSELRTLKARWGSQTTLSGQAALFGKAEIPFPATPDNYIDLRGLVISQAITNLSVSFVDLSGAVLKGFGQLGKCRIDHSLFQYASLQTNIGSEFRLCDFTSAKLNGAILRGKFEDCDFTSANLSAARGEQVHFIRCTFIGTNLNRSELYHCIFEDCTFETCKFGSGSFAFSTFLRSPIQVEHLKNTLMEKVKFDDNSGKS